MHPARLFVLCGLPGSGTTTRATELEERFGAVRMSAIDRMSALAHDVRDQGVRTQIEAIQRQLLLPVLRAGTDVVIEWGTWTRVERTELRAVAATPARWRTSSSWTHRSISCGIVSGAGPMSR